jgi:Flp pilus assembly protein TadG
MSSTLRHLSAPAHGSRGAIAIEFALVTLFLVPLIIGIVEVGRALYAYDVLTKSVRSAARFVSSGRVTDAARLAAARCIVITGSPAMSGGACSSAAPQLPDLDSPSVVITILTPADTPGVNDVSTGALTGAIDLVTVSVDGYPMSKITALLYPTATLGPISATVPHVNF